MMDKPSSTIPEDADSVSRASGYGSADKDDISISGELGVKPSASRGPRVLNEWLEILGIFAFASIVRWLYCFVFVHANNYAACDAFEYIQNAQLLLEAQKFPASFWEAASHCLSSAGSTKAEWELVRTTLVPMKDFYISGPVFPAALAACAALAGFNTGGSQSLANFWQPLLIGNILSSSLTCVMITLCAREAFGKNCGRVAGVLSALYPAFIVNSGRLYSETFATFLLSAIIYIALIGFRKGGNNIALVFLSGFLAAALQLTRSIMVAVTIVLIPLTVFQKLDSQKLGSVKNTESGLSLLSMILRKFLWLIPFALGFFLLAIPWLGFQKLAFGGGGLVVDRVGRYNFFIGNNVETQGWLSYPYPDGRGVESRSFGDLAVSAIKKNPARWFRLMLDKPLRLFKYPWNDFRTSIGPFTFHTQVLFHELLLLFGALGICVATFTHLRFGKIASAGQFAELLAPGSAGVPPASENVSNNKTANAEAMSEPSDPGSAADLRSPASQSAKPASADAISEPSIPGSAGFQPASSPALPDSPKPSDESIADVDANQSEAITKRVLYCRTFLLGLLAFHSIYFLFITVPRYNLSAIPEIIIFASAGICFVSTLISKQLKRRQENSAALIAIAALFTFFLVARINFIPVMLELFPESLANSAPQICWTIQSCLRVLILAVCSAFLWRAVASMIGYRKVSAALIACFSIAMIPLLALPQRANGRWAEWRETLRSMDNGVEQTMFIPLKDLEGAHDRLVYLLVDTDAVRQFADGVKISINNKEISGPLFPSMSFAESFDRFLETGQAHFQREGEKMWSDLNLAADYSNLDQRQWSLVPIPEAILKDADALAKAEGTERASFRVQLSYKPQSLSSSGKGSTEDAGMQIFGSYVPNKTELILPSASDYSWEKAFYGVENSDGMTDTRYDIKIPQSARQLRSADLSKDSGIQNGSYNLAFLIAPPAFSSPDSGKSHLTPATSTVSSLNNSSASPLRKLYSHPLDSASVDASTPIIAELDLSKIKVTTGQLWVIRLRGKTAIATVSKSVSGASSGDSKNLSIETVAGASHIRPSAIFKKSDGSSFTLDSAWSPLSIKAGQDPKNFELVFPLAPVMNGANIEKAAIMFGIVPEGPSYCNVLRRAAGTAEFTDMTVDVLELPSNPLGLGHRIL